MSTYTHTVIILHAQHIHTTATHQAGCTRPYTSTRARLWMNTHTINYSRKGFLHPSVTAYTLLTACFLQPTQLFFLFFFVKTMMWQASCCVFGGLLIISRLSDQQTRVVTFRAGFLCIGTKDRVWWHLTKQPVRPVDVIKTKSIISYVLVPNWCVKKKLCIVSQSHLFLLSWYISK